MSEEGIVFGGIALVFFLLISGLILEGCQKTCVDRCNNVFVSRGAISDRFMLEKCYEACKECDK